MEDFYPQLAENNLQILLIEKMAEKMWVNAEALSPHWIDLYSPVFREIWDSGEHDVDTIEERIYRPTLGSNWADSVAAILIWKPDPRLTQ